MRRFAEIEGLRALLAWAVVLWHLLLFSDLDEVSYFAKAVSAFSGVAVDLFIIISGFVISHLVLARRERWSAYIVRRWFRIFPAYLVVVVAGALTAPLVAGVMRDVSWPPRDGGGGYAETAIGLYQSQVEYFWWHVLTHSFLLQGAVPDSVLPYSSATFLGPAWSLSLEWQFYLIAPILVVALISRWVRIPLVTLLFGCSILFTYGIFGDYRLRSLFFGCSYLFICGILSRLHFETVRRYRASVLACGCALILGAAFERSLLSIGLWMVFFYFMLGPVVGESGESVLQHVWRMVFGNRFIRYLGERSYSVYIGHWPVVQLAIWIVVPNVTSRTVAVLLVSLATVPCTLLVSSLLFRFVERPGIRCGSWIASALNRRGTTVSVPKSELIQP